MLLRPKSDAVVQGCTAMGKLLADGVHVIIHERLNASVPYHAVPAT